MNLTPHACGIFGYIVKTALLFGLWFFANYPYILPFLMPKNNYEIMLVEWVDVDVLLLHHLIATNFQLHLVHILHCHQYTWLQHYPSQIVGIKCTLPLEKTCMYPKKQFLDNLLKV